MKRQPVRLRNNYLLKIVEAFKMKNRIIKILSQKNQERKKQRLLN